MTTNLLASIIITIATNVTEESTQWEMFELNQAIPLSSTYTPAYYTFPEQRGVNPTEKLVTSNVVETTTLSFDWQGKREIKVDRVLSSACWLLKRQVQETWVVQSAPSVTNVTSYIVITNESPSKPQ